MGSSIFCSLEVWCELYSFCSETCNKIASYLKCINLLEEEKSFLWNVLVASWNVCNFLLPHKFNTYLLPFGFVSSTCAFAGTCSLFEYIWYGTSSIEVALVDAHLEWWGLIISLLMGYNIWKPLMIKLKFQLCLNLNW